jgi:hypothetical protein
MNYSDFFFSDEGDSSSSSDDEGKDSLCDLEGPCCQALRVPPCSPALSPKKQASGKKKVVTDKSLLVNLRRDLFSKKTLSRPCHSHPPPSTQTGAKNKQRRRNISPTKRNKLLTRSVMDLPTTDPGSDFPDYYTTDDECETDYDTNLPRVGKILRGDMRKANSASCEAMPPELIITKVGAETWMEVKKCY